MNRDKPSKKSCFMREYYHSHYEDPVGVMIRNSKRGKELVEQRLNYVQTFQEELAKKAPELMEIYSKLVDITFRWQSALAEEAYILGVQDRDRALSPQK
ncbi:MAG: hypothetical protein ACI4LP_05865 [Anaerovoracaceae bacterium]